MRLDALGALVATREWRPGPPEKSSDGGRTCWKRTVHLLAERQRSRVTRRCYTLPQAHIGRRVVRRVPGRLQRPRRSGGSRDRSPHRRARIVLRRAPWQWKPGRRGYTVHATRHEKELIKITTVGAALMDAGSACAWSPAATTAT